MFLSFSRARRGWRAEKGRKIPGRYRHFRLVKQRGGMVELKRILPMRYLLSIILLVMASAAAMTEAVELQRVWSSATFSGVDYVNLREICRRYGYGALPQQKGMLAYGKVEGVRQDSPLKHNYRLFLRPGKQDFFVENYRFVLTYPVRESNGQIYISAVDFEKLIDPVLNPTLSKSRNFNTVVLDAGHGGHDHGATSSYAREKDCNLALALKVRSKLVAKGFRVVMTRNGDYFLTLGERVAIANRVPNAIFVSIHHNSSGRSAAQGIETFTLAPHGTTSPFARTRRTENLSGNDQDSENIALAAAVHSHVMNGLVKKNHPTPDRGIQRARFSVLCTIRCPAILFEGGFVSNPAEGRKISSNAYQEMLAEYICSGIVRYRDTATGKATQGSRPQGTSKGIRPTSS